jgi:hypothetical protein
LVIPLDECLYAVATDAGAYVDSGTLKRRLSDLLRQMHLFMAMPLNVWLTDDPK